MVGFTISGFIDYIQQTSDKICSFVRSKEDNDIVIAPFSELARFYNNNKPDIEFDTLISDIKAIQASHIAYRNHQRVYIPIVGLEAKMSKFYNDSQITVWDYKNPKPQRNYRLILTNGSTYGVNGLDNNYSVVSSVSEWLRLWRDQRMKRDIICTSRSIFAYAEYAQPDNAFDFVPCNSVHKFLTNGLGLHLSFLSSKEADKHWLELAKEINIESFDFKTFSMLNSTYTLLLVLKFLSKLGLKTNFHLIVGYSLHTIRKSSVQKDIFVSPLKI